MGGVRVNRAIRLVLNLTLRISNGAGKVGCRTIKVGVGNL